MNLALVLRGPVSSPLGSVDSLFLVVLSLVPNNFSFLVGAAVGSCLVKCFVWSLCVPLDGDGGAAGSAVGASVTICSPGMHLDGGYVPIRKCPLGGDTGGSGDMCPSTALIMYP